ncbi:MAG TPA: c-type cytochrome [Gemmatimonadales bacterium]|nr:c-type cytochrome [Gemmatimonadales bacterium]
MCLPFRNRENLRRIRIRGSARRLALASSLLLVLSACEREKRQFETWPPSAAASTAVREVELQPGPPTRSVDVRGPYANNAFGVSEGKRLYNQMNCSGCHFQGGGGIGPALMDAEWIYGSAPENIFETIVEGRPNGMPAFGGKLGTDQVWQLVAYVRSMSGLLPKDIAPGRNDDMQVRSQEQATEKALPQQSTLPPSGERP